MGSTASSSATKKKPVKSKKAGVKKKSVRKVAAKKTRASTVKKKSTAKKKVTATGKATRKKPATKKRASRKKVATRSVKTPATQVDATTTAGEDASKSLSWMAAQAASALQAVKANQNERAQVLLAKAEISPARPVKPHKGSSVPVAAELPEASNDSRADAAPQPLKSKVSKLDKPARATHIAAVPARTADKPVVKQIPTAVPPGKTATGQVLPVPSAPADTTPADVKITATVPAETEAPDQPDTERHTALPPAVVTANNRSKRPILLAGIIIIAGILVIRAWFSEDDTVDSATMRAHVATEQLAPAVSTPPAATVTTSQPAAASATVTPPVKNWSPAARPAWQAHTAVPPATPAVPPAGSYPPVYNYYPRQPVRQQHDYWSTYPRPSYSH